MNNMNIYRNSDGKKPWWRSKTIWFNVVTVLLGFIQIVNQHFVIPPEWLAYIMGLGNVILRFITETKLTSTK